MACKRKRKANSQTQTKLSIHASYVQILLEKILSQIQNSIRLLQHPIYNLAIPHQPLP